MAIVRLSGFEMGDLGEWPSITGSPSVVETNGWGSPKTGDYAMRCNPSAATAYVAAGLGWCPRLTFYLYIAAAPDVDCCISGSPASFGAIFLTTNRELDLYTDGVKRIDGTTQLNLNTWYRVSWWHDEGNDDSYIYLDGVQECFYGTGGGIFGNIGVISSCSADLYFDDFVFDDATGAGDLGDIRVLRASPNAAGEYAEFDTISGYTNCDEVPASDDDFVDDSGASVLHRECYNLQDCATIGLVSSNVIKAISVWIRLYDSGNSAQGIIVRDNSTDYLTLAIAGKAFTWKNKVYDTTAPRGTAWTQAIFDAFQSGGYSEGSKDVYMSCVMVMVAFIPGAPPPVYIPRHSGTVGVLMI